MAYHYGPPPAHYQRFEPTSPYDSGEYVQYFASHETPVKRGHSRKNSHASPKVGGYYSPAGDSPPYYEEYATPRKQVYVSTTKEGKAKREYYYSSGTSHQRVEPQQKQPVHIYNDDADYATPHYVYRTPSKKQKRTGRPAADTAFYYGQDQVYEQQPKRTTPTRPRRSSTTTKPKHKSKPSYSPPQATEADAAAAGIPAGYSVKNWDPTELPIILLGSVFDANSLGKWIYDWTVYRYTASHPFADIAGEMWLLLIKLAGKMKRGKECLPRIRNRDNYELVEDFLESASRLWRSFKELLKDCEYYMLKAAKREGTRKMGKNAGTEFVDSIFGRDRFLDQTEQLTQKIRTWDHRFDVNCEGILRRPSVA